MREMVGKSRNTVFSQWFGAPEGRKVGSLKRRVRSQLARWEMRNCTPLWREAHFQVKMYKTPQRRTTFGSWDVEKVHAIVARSTFGSQNVQNTSASDDFWKLRCPKSGRRCGAKQKWTPLWREARLKVKMYKTPQLRTIFGSWDVQKVHAVVARSTFRSQNAQNTPWSEHFWKLRCPTLWREAHLEVKMLKPLGVRTTFGSADLEKVHAVVARSTFPSQNVKNTRGSDHFWKFRSRKSARRCGTKHISKSKCNKTDQVRTTFGSSDVEKVHAVVARSTFRCENVQNTKCSDHFWRFRCRFASLHYITLHYTPLHCTALHDTTLHNTTTIHNYTPLHSTTLHYTKSHYTILHYTTLHSTTLHYITLHYLPLHFTTLHHTTLQYTTTTTTQLHSTTLNYTTLHYTTLHSTTLHYTTLHYLPLHFTTLHYTALHYTTTTTTNTQLHSTTLHYTKLHYTTLHYTTLHYIPLHSTTLHYIPLHYITLNDTAPQIDSSTDRQIDR